MAKYGYTYGGNSAKSGFPRRSDEGSKPSYASESDHLSQPVIVDAEGRKMPIILETSSNCAQRYVAEVETTVEQVCAPLVIEYRHSSPPKVMPTKDYGQRHSSLPKLEQTKDYGYKVDPVKDYGYKHGAQTKDELVNDYGYEVEPMKDYRYKHSSPPKVEPVKDYGYKNSFPAKVEPMKNYGYKAEPVKDYEYKPEPVKEYAYKVEPIKDYEYKPEPLRDYGYKSEPVKGRGYNQAQSDKQNSNYSRFRVPAIQKPVPKRDTYTEIIDSREAARRYGNLISQPQTIDSKEAARKYGGVLIK
nr:extensin-3-like [Quercus suber]POE87174.1 hypothetical protein CFP56_65777 [Quercus suber]